MAYFCNGCLEFWKRGEFMKGCKECKYMKDKWGKTPVESAIRALEVWEPIVAWCKGHNMKAWVKQPNEYTKRKLFKGIKVKIPNGQSEFWDQQRVFVQMYNKSLLPEHWDLLHPKTQCYMHAKKQGDLMQRNQLRI